MIHQKEYSADGVTQVHNHMLWWLSYCRKIKFQIIRLHWEILKAIFEVLIYLFSKYTHAGF